MLRAFYLLPLTLMIWSSSAHAQPLFNYEHDWTVKLGGRSYGLRQVAQIPGDLRRTQVWLGRYSFDISGRAGEAIALAVLSPITLARRIEWGTFTRWP